MWFDGKGLTEERHLLHIPCELRGRGRSAAFLEQLPQLGDGDVLEVLAEQLVGLVAAPVESNGVVLGASYDAEASSRRHEILAEGV